MLLFTPITIRGLTARDRVMVSRIEQFAAGREGRATDFHPAQIGRVALRGCRSTVDGSDEAREFLAAGIAESA